MGALAGLAAVGAPRIAGAAEVLKIATIFPASSPWGQVLKVWADAVNQKSGGAVQLQIFSNATQGDEAAAVRKVKDGNLDGVVTTAVGLGKIHGPILAMQMPGLFSAWSKVDAARDALKGEFEQGMRDAGFINVGWIDVGHQHVMSKGFAVRSPDDLKGKKPWSWRDEAIVSSVYQVIGGITPVSLNLPEVLPNFNTGAINVSWGAPLLSEQLQWTSKLDTIISGFFATSIGAIALSRKRFEALPEDMRNIVLDTGRIAAAALLKRIRNENDTSLARLKGKMTVIELTEDEKTRWTAIFKQTRQKLAQGTFSADLVARLESMAG